MGVTIDHKAHERSLYGLGMSAQFGSIVFFPSSWAIFINFFLNPLFHISSLLMARIIRRYVRNIIYRLNFESQFSWMVHNFKSEEILMFTIFDVHRRGYQFFEPSLWNIFISNIVPMWVRFQLNLCVLIIVDIVFYFVMFLWSINNVCRLLSYSSSMLCCTVVDLGVVGPTEKGFRIC